MVFPLRHAVTCACQDPARRDTANQLPSWIDSAHAVAGRLVDGGRLARRANRCNCGFGALAVEASQLDAQDLRKLADDPAAEQQHADDENHALDDEYPL